MQHVASRKHDPATKALQWKRVIFSADCDEDGNCPVCGIDYGECGCPGPTMDGMEYRTIRGVLYARPVA